MTQHNATNPGSGSPPGSTAMGNTTTRAEQLAAVLTTPLAVAQRVIPTSPVPVALGTGALVLAGIVEWPIAGAVGLGYLALRTWRRAQR
jgi:biotin transporter BioY